MNKFGSVGMQIAFGRIRRKTEPTGSWDRVRKSYMTTSSKYRSGNQYKGRVSIPGAYYHIIICTHQRQKILANNTIVSIIFDTFDWLETENRLEWICIMVMPDHIHTVIRLGEGQPLSKVLHSVKLFTARHINKHLSRKGTLWQKGYTDWGIRTEATLNKTISYCYMNRCVGLKQISQIW